MYKGSEISAREYWDAVAGCGREWAKADVR